MLKQLLRYWNKTQTTAWVIYTINVKDFTNIAVDIVSIAWSDQIIKFVGSVQDTQPDFSINAIPTNSWQYIQSVDLTTWWNIAWTSWYTFAWVESKIFEINTNILSYVWIVITNWTAWAITTWITLSNNT